MRLVCLLCSITFMLSCQSAPDPVPVVDTNVVPPAQAAIVSVQPLAGGQAEVVVKYSRLFQATNYQLSGQATTGAALALTEGNTQSLTPFILTSYRVNGLTAGQTYRFRLRFPYDQKDTLTLERAYTHRTDGPTWTRLAHLPADAGDFTGTPVASDFERTGGSIGVARYVDEKTTEPWLYYRSLDSWRTDPNSPVLTMPPRRGMLQFNLYFENIDRYYHYGMGYQVSDLFPNKYIYLRDLKVVTPASGSYVFPQYQGEDGEVAFFTTTDRAFFLTQNGSPAMRSIYATSEQEARQPLPEKPGLLATFSIGNTGYVVNQVTGRAPRLWAYDSENDVWTRKADFPGTQRTRGVGFSTKGKGYFGLGAATDQQGLRDIWEYDPVGDKWQYVTDYPGQGNRYLIALSTPGRAFLGWGYESQTAVGLSGIRLTGCTDFWEFIP